MTRQDIERLQAAGFTQAEIDAFVAEKSTQSAGMAAPPASQDLPQVDLDSPSQAITEARNRGQDIMGAAPPLLGYETAFEVGPSAAKGAAYAGGAYAGYRATRGLINRFAPSPAQQTMNTLRASEAANQARAAGQQPGMASRVMSAAYDRVIKPAAEATMNMARTQAPMIRGGMGALAALVPGNIGQNYPFPTTGPLAGREINPQTGRPWTAMELDAYNSTQR